MTDIEKQQAEAELQTPQWLQSEITAVTNCTVTGLQNYTRRLDRELFDFIETGASQTGPRLYSTRDAIFIGALTVFNQLKVSPAGAAVYAGRVRDFACEMALASTNSYADLAQLYFVIDNDLLRPRPLTEPEFLRKISEVTTRGAIVFNVTAVLRHIVGSLAAGRQHRQRRGES